MEIHDGEKILNLIEAEKYEEVFGIPINASTREINRAHLILLKRFGNNQNIIEAINKAKIILVNENDWEKGSRLLKTGKINEAISFLKNAVELKGNASDYSCLGIVLYELRKYEEALVYLKRAVNLRGNAIDCILLGSTLYQLGRDTDALRYFKKAKKLQGNADIFVLIIRIVVKIVLFAGPVGFYFLTKSFIWTVIFTIIIWVYCVPLVKKKRL